MNDQTSLFGGENTVSPLAERVRPADLDSFVGQCHLLGQGKILRQMIDSGKISSMILWGPPGVGKTTLAMILSSAVRSRFISCSAATSGIKEIKERMSAAHVFRENGGSTVLFVDEIHRFNKAQQDAFLPYVENGDIILIGATTENPSFEINAALLSRCRVFVLEPLQMTDILQVLKNALNDPRGLGEKGITAPDDVLSQLAVFSNGDARTALNTLELAVSGLKPGAVLTKADITESAGKKALLYDKNGEEHYNLISALHKSMRNSDCDASVYWLARMLESGEDPLYVARRVIRFASEDIGLADPRALEIAVNAYHAANMIGMPECTVNLAEAVIYMACAPKSNAIYAAYQKAKADALETLSQGVPLHLRNAPTGLMSDLGYGKGYKYAHDFKEKTAAMQCLPDNLAGRCYYEPGNNGVEIKIRQRLETIKKLQKDM